MVILEKSNPSEEDGPGVTGRWGSALGSTEQILGVVVVQTCVCANFCRTPGEKLTIHRSSRHGVSKTAGSILFQGTLGKEPQMSRKHKFSFLMEALGAGLVGATGWLHSLKMSPPDIY